METDGSNCPSLDPRLQAFQVRLQDIVPEILLCEWSFVASFNQVIDVDNCFVRSRLEPDARRLKEPVSDNIILEEHRIQSRRRMSPGRRTRAARQRNGEIDVEGTMELVLAVSRLGWVSPD